MFTDLVVRWLDDGFPWFFMTVASKKTMAGPGPSELQLQLRTHGGPGEQRPAAQLPNQGGWAGELRGQGLGTKSRGMAPWEDGEDGEDDPNWDILGV